MVNNTRHLRLPKLGGWRPSRKLIIWVAVGLVVAALAGTGGWQLWQNNQYHQDVSKYQTGIHTLLDGSKTNIEQFLATGQTSKTADAMSDLADSLDVHVRQQPSEPRLFGLQLGTNTDAATTQKVTVAATQYAKDLRDAAGFIKYQNSVVGALTPLTTKSSANIDQLNELVSTWTGASAAIKAVVAPDKAKDVHVALVLSIADAVTAVTRMPELYKKIDTAGFTAAKKDLEAAITALKAQGVQVAELAKVYDIVLVADRSKF